jgi:hypothetical protein
VVNVALQPLYPRRKSPGTHWLGSWVSPRTVVHVLGKSFKPQMVQPVAKSL